MTTTALQGKHAVITGGSRGIGLAIARSLADYGATVTLLGRDQSALMTATKSLSPLSKFVLADVADSQAVAQAFAQARAESGPIDILINNAGQAASAPFLKTDVALWKCMMSVNLDGVFHCTHAALPDMLHSGWGRIINIASTAGLTGYSYVTAYCAAKHAVIGLTRSLARELATKHITVNAVCPGYTETSMLEQSIEAIVAKTKRTPEQVRAELSTHNPQQRMVRPEEVANAVAWLCLSGSDAITGQSIAVAGGEVM